MATQSISDDKQDSPLIDRGRWDRTVVATKKGVLCWGTHRQAARLQVFEDGTGNLQIAAPSKPPYAEAWIADWLNTDATKHAAAHILADAWNINIDEVTQ